MDKQAFLISVYTDDYVCQPLVIIIPDFKFATPLEILENYAQKYGFDIRKLRYQKLDTLSLSEVVVSKGEFMLSQTNIMIIQWSRTKLPIKIESGQEQADITS